MVLSSDSERVSLATGGREFHREMEDGIGERRRLRERYKKVRRAKRANGVRRRRSWLENIKKKVKKVVVNLKNQNKF